MVVSHLTRSHWRKVNSEETEQMKSYQVFVGGGTNLDLWVSALSIVDHNKESGGPRGPPRSLVGYHCWPSKSAPQRRSSQISILDYKLTNLSPQDIVFVR